MTSWCLRSLSTAGGYEYSGGGGGYSGGGGGGYSGGVGGGYSYDQRGGGGGAYGGFDDRQAGQQAAAPSHAQQHYPAEAAG